MITEDTTPTTELEHRAYWSTKQVCQRYGGVTAKSLKRYQELKGMPKPIKSLGVNLYSIHALLAWEAEVFGSVVFPKNWDTPDATELPKLKSEAIADE